jgi:hypothetical protein
MQYYYVLVVGISTSEIPFRLHDIRSFIAATTRLPQSMWRVMLSNVDEAGGPRSVEAAGIRFVYPGNDRRINAAGRIPQFPSASFSLIISDARSPEIEPTELVRLLKPGGVACVARDLPPRRAAPRCLLTRAAAPQVLRQLGRARPREAGAKRRGRARRHRGCGRRTARDVAAAAPHRARRTPRLLWPVRSRRGREGAGAPAGDAQVRDYPAARRRLFRPRRALGHALRTRV